MMKYLKVEPLDGSNGKAQVVRLMFADGNREISVLFSYGLMMAVVSDGKMWKVNSSPSSTTSKHVRLFTGLNQSQFNALPSCGESVALSLSGPSCPVYAGNPRGEV